MPNTQELKDLTTQVRRDILRMVHKVNSGHPGGSLGCAEFFVTLYQDIMKTKDGFDSFVTNPKSTVVNDWQKYTKNDKICVDKIIEYNNLHNEFAEVCSILGIPYNNELKRTYLKGQHRKDKNYRSMYNKEIRDVVSRQYEKPINYFNYKF